MTAATNPTLEDLLRGVDPGHARGSSIYNPVLAFETGEDFMRAWYDAASGPARPVRARARGLGPNEEINGDGHWAGSASTARPASRSRPARGSTGWRRRAAAVLALGTCAAYGGIPAMRNNPTGAMGLRDYLGSGWQSRGSGIPVVNLPGCPVQPDNITETLLRLVLQLGGTGAADRARRPGPPASAVRPHRARELRPRRLRRARASSPTRSATAAAWSSSAAAGPVVQVQRARCAAG